MSQNPSSPATPIEIERKFLVRSLPLIHGSGDAIVQGYVMTGASEVRVRVRNGVYLETVKEGEGVARMETEAQISRRLGHALLRASGDRVVEKHRYVFAEGWEVDVYGGKLEGLVVAEIELKPSTASGRMALALEDAAHAGMSMPLPPLPPGLALGKEVTNDKAFKNQSLAGLSVADAREMIGRLAPVERAGGPTSEGARKL